MLPAQINGKARLAVSTIFFIIGCSWGSWVSRLNAFKDQFAVGDGLLSIGLFSSGIGAVGAMALAGRFCARYGSRMVVSQTIAPLCLVLSLLSFSPNFEFFCFCLLVIGFIGSIADVSMNAHAVLVERLYKGPIMSSFHGFFSAGGMAGGLIGSLAAQYSLTPKIHLALVAILLFIVGMISQALLLPSEMDKHSERTSDATQPRAWKLDSVIAGLATVCLCSFVSEGAMGDWSAIYLHSSLGTSESFAALGFACFNVSMCIGRFFGDAIVHRFGAVKTVRLGALLAMLGLAEALSFSNPWAALAGLALVGLGLSTIVPNVFTAAGNSSPSAGMGIATVAVVGYIGLLLGPPIIGFTAEVVGLKDALLLVLSLEGLIVFLAGFLKPLEAPPLLTVMSPNPDILN